MSDYTIQRLRGKLAIVWHEDGKRRRHTLATTDLATAQALARSIWQQRKVGKEVRTVGEAVDAYLDAKADIASIPRAKVAWKAAKPFWEGLPVAKVDDQASLDYRQKRAHCRAITVRNELAVIRAALNWAAKKGLLDKAPAIVMPSIPPTPVTHITKAQFRKIIDAANAPHVALFLKVAAATGARSNAILDLKWDQVDFARGLIHLNPRDRVQTAKYRATVPMNGQLRKALEEAKAGALSDYVIEHGRGRVGSIKKGFAAACARAGVKATPHMIRHSSAVWMAEDGIPIFQIAQFLGHTDSRITEKHYAKFAPAFLAKAAESLTW